MKVMTFFLLQTVCFKYQLQDCLLNHKSQFKLKKECTIVFKSKFYTGFLKVLRRWYHSHYIHAWFTFECAFELRIKDASRIPAANHHLQESAEGKVDASLILP